MRRDRAQPIRQADDAPAAVPNGRDGRRLRARPKLPQPGYVARNFCPSPSFLFFFFLRNLSPFSRTLRRMGQNIKIKLNPVKGPKPLPVLIPSSLSS